MKKAYIKPTLESETFVPNTYVAACGDSGTVYYFECNAGNSRESYNVFFADGRPYASSNGYDEWSCRWSGYHPCGSAHEAASNSGFYDGYMYQQNKWGDNTGNRIDVVIWTDNGSNVHCTTNLKQEDWETVKS